MKLKIDWHKVLVVYRKEILDIMRDRRTIIINVVIPLLLYPLLFIGLSGLTSRQMKKIEDQGALVYIDDQVKNEYSQAISDSIRSLPKYQFYEQTTNWQRLYDEQILQAVTVIKDTLNADGTKYYLTRTFYDGTREKSDMAFKKIDEKINAAKKKIIQNELEIHSVPAQLMDFVAVEAQNTAGSEKMIGFLMSKMLPYLLIVITLSGALTVSTDLVAGEKEKGTLETILVSGAQRIDLILGKYLTIITASIVTLLLNVVSLSISIQQTLKMAGGIGMNLPSLPVNKFGLIIIAMLPLITLFSALLLSISTFSRNIKEARSLESPLLTISMVISMITLLPGMQIGVGTALIPIVNVALLFKAIFLDEMQWLHFWITTGSTLVLDGFAIALCINLFNREGVLFRSAETKKIFVKKGKNNLFEPQVAFVVFIVLFLLLFYVGQRWQIKNLEKGLIQTQLLLILLPAFLLARFSGKNAKALLTLDKFDAKAVITGVLAFIPLLLAISGISRLIDVFFPLPANYLEFFTNLLGGEKERSLINSLLLIGILPGVCEELLFRGYFLNSFKKMGPYAAIILSAVLFAVFHMDMYRLLPVLLLGLWFGYLAYTSRSIYPTMLAHALNNSAAVAVGYFSTVKLCKYLETPPWYLHVAGAVIFGVIFYYYRKSLKREVL